MGQRGRKKYLCEDCGAESWHHWIERNRAARMRCTNCGSARLEFATTEAKKEAVAAQTVRVEGHRDMTRPPGEPDQKRKVT